MPDTLTCWLYRVVNFIYIVGMNLNCHIGEGLNVKGVSKDKELKDTNIETLDVKG